MVNLIIIGKKDQRVQIHRVFLVYALYFYFKSESILKTDNDKTAR
jgi:hypothetical protein